MYPPGMVLRPLEGWPRGFTADRKRSRFEASLSETVELLGRELRHLYQGHSGPSVLQLALREQDFRNDGMPRAGSSPAHPGVILSIEPPGVPAMSFPCDTFTHWHHNLRAIALTLESLRKINRYGVTQASEQYRGWQAIEAKPSTTQQAVLDAARTVVGLAWPNEPDSARNKWAADIIAIGRVSDRLHRMARANAHPDRNAGDNTRWGSLEAAVGVLRAAGIEVRL